MQDKDEDRPLVSIQPYQDRSNEGPKVGKTMFGGPQQVLPSQIKNSSKKEKVLDRKNSFQEIQKKFKSMELKQEEEKKDKKIRPVPVIIKSKESGKSNVEAKMFRKKDESEMEMWPKTDKDTGYVSRDKSRSRDFETTEVDKDSQTSKKLESYLINKKVEEKAKVARQASKCSSAMSPVYKRNMEAVGEFEKVWSWADKELPNDNNRVPLTKELSPEFKRDHRQRNRAISPVERKSRPKSPEPAPMRSPRGVSTPAGESKSRRPLYTPSGNVRRRAMSPEVIRRSSSRGGAFSPDPVRVLRREKTSVFDNRYPSLDMRSDKRKSMYELQEPDLRRRSYHELNNPEMLNQMSAHNFQHSGKKSKDSKLPRNLHPRPHPHLIAMGPPPPPHGWGGHDPRGYPGFHPPPPPPGMHHPGPPMGHPHHPHQMHHHGRQPPMGRFGLAPIRPY